jgi:hypothetical protein
MNDPYCDYATDSAHSSSHGLGSQAADRAAMGGRRPGDFAAMGGRRPGDFAAMGGRRPGDFAAMGAAQKKSYEPDPKPVKKPKKGKK